MGRLLIVAIMLLYLTAGMLDAQTRVQTTTGSTGTVAATSFTASLTNAPVSGNTLVAVIATRSTSAGSVTGLSQTGATWVRAEYSRGTNGITTEIWYTSALTSADKVVTINQSSARTAAVIVEYSGLIYGTPLDVVANASSTGTAASTGTTATTTQTNELWIGGVGLRSSGYTLSAVTNSFSPVTSSSSTNSTSTNNAKIYALERIVTAVSAAGSGGTISSSSYWSGAIAAFKVADITGFSPTSICSGSSGTVTINGQGFMNGAVVYFNGKAASTRYVNSNQLTATVPSTATSGFITVSNNGTTLTGKKPFLIKTAVQPEATVTNTACPASTDGAITPTNIPVAANFDYTKSQYINLGSPLLNNLSAFTLEGWINTSAYSRNSFFGQNNAIEIGLTSDGRIELWSEGLMTNIFSPTTYTKDGLWHHVAGTGDGSVLKIFIDGELVMSGTHTPTTNYGSSSYNAMIGGFVWDATVPNYFNGQVLKTGFWNRALTNSEIIALASSPHRYTNDDAGLIAGYNFFENNGVVLSKVPSGTNGTFTGTTLSDRTDLFSYSWTKSEDTFTATSKSISGVSPGIYTLSATFNSCATAGSDFVVGSNGFESTPAGSINGNSPVCSGTLVTLSVSGGALGTGASWKWYTDNQGHNLVGTGPTIDVTPTLTTTYYVRAEGSCNNSDFTSFTVVVNSHGEWLGTADTNWNNTGNWCGGIPDAETDVIIPSGTLYQPTISNGGAVCKSITIQTGATLNVSGDNMLTIHGNWINNGTFAPDNGKVSVNGNAVILGDSVTIFHDLTINAGKTLTGHPVMFKLTGDWINNGGYTHNSGTVGFYGSVPQSLTGESVFNNLTIDNNAGVVAGSNFEVDGVLNLVSASPNETNGTLEMTRNYGDYSNILTPTDSLTTRKTRSWDILDSYILLMGQDATTVGSGDVTGKVKRTAFSENIAYTFGNVYNSLEFNKNTTGTLPAAVMFVITKGSDRGVHANKTNTVRRLMQIIRTGGTEPTTFTLKLHYDDAELNGNAEGSLVLWDHHIPYTSVNTPHEHGETLQNTTENWLELSGHGINYLASQEVVGGFSKYWMFGDSQVAGNEWLGSSYGHYTDWNYPSNWTKGSVPDCIDRVVIPATTNVPTLPDGTALNPAANAFSIEIKPGATLNGGTGGLLTICGGVAVNGGKGSWINNGTFNPGTSSVTFAYTRASNMETATITGTANFYNMTVALGTKMVPQENSLVSISNSLTQLGEIDAMTHLNTFDYRGDNSQTVVRPSISGGYVNLILSGNGTKSLPSSELKVAGSLTLNSGFTALLNTLVFCGSTAQTISGTSTSALNNITINNPGGVVLNSNLYADGVLNLTNGLITTGLNSLTLNCSASTVNSGATSYVNGQLIRKYCGESSHFFPIGKNGVYRPITVERNSGGLATTAIQAEQFESEIAGFVPQYTSVFADRYWRILQTQGNEMYSITLDATGFDPNGTAVIVNGDGTQQTQLSLLSVTTPDYTTQVASSITGDFTLASQCEPVTIESQPRDTAVSAVNTTAFFKVKQSAPNAVYAWQYSADNGVSWQSVAEDAVFAGVNNDTLSILNPSYVWNNSMFRAAIANDCGTTVLSSPAILTVYPEPQGSLSAQSDVCKGEIGYLVWTSSLGTAPFSLVINNGANTVQYDNVESGVPFGVGVINSSTTFSLISVADKNSVRTSSFTSGSAVISVRPYVTWTGAVDADWHNAGNWCGGVPSSSDNVLIPSSPTNQPVLSSGNGYTNSIIVESGASVTISNSSLALNVSGNITNSGTMDFGKGSLTIGQNTIIENNGMMETGNASQQPLPESPNYGNGGSIRFKSTEAVQTLVPGTYYNIYIDNTKGVVMPESAEVKANGKLEIGAGATFEVGAGRSVAVKSLVNHAGTSGIVIKSSAELPSGTLIFDNSENDAVNAGVEMYSKSSWDLTQSVNSKYKWQFIGIPVQSLSALPSFSGGYVRKYNEAGNGAGTAETSRWIQLQAGSSLEAVEGYETVMQTPRILQFSGQLFNGDINKVLNYTVGADYPGQHIIGNPYTAAIDIRKIQLGENMDSTIYIYNTGTFSNWNDYRGSSSPDGTTAGQYTAIPQNIAGLGLIPGQIPAMQAFLVKTKSAADGSIRISYSSVKQNNTVMQRAKSKSDAWMRINLVGATMDNDVMWIFIHEGTSMGYDNGWDGIKMGGDVGTARIQSVYDSKNFQINTVPDINNVMISVRAGANDTQYMLKVTSENMVDYYENISLLDMAVDSVIDITRSGSTYYFTMTNTSSLLRFKIFTKTNDGTTDLSAEKRDLMAYCNNSELIVRNKTGVGGRVIISNVQGHQVLNEPYSSDLYTVVKLGLSPGIYIYELKNEHKDSVKSKLIIE